MLNSYRNQIQVIMGQVGSGKTSLIKYQLQSMPCYILYDPLGEYEQGIIFEDLVEVIDYLISNRDSMYQIIYRPADANEVDFTEFCRIAWTLSDVHIIIDEIDMVTTVHSINMYLARIIRYGRHYNHNLICIVRVPPDLNRVITSQASEFCVFKITEPRYLDYFKKLIPMEVTRLSALQVFEYIHYDHATVSKLKVPFIY